MGRIHKSARGDPGIDTGIIRSAPVTGPYYVCKLVVRLRHAPVVWCLHRHDVGPLQRVRMSRPRLHIPTFHLAAAGAENNRAQISRDPIMRNLITTAALLAMLRSPVAIAQTTGSAKWSAGPASPTLSLSLTPEMRSIGRAPVGHRQPRASDVPHENSSFNRMEDLSAEDAAVDRKINNICRGC